MGWITAGTISRKAFAGKLLVDESTAKGALEKQTGGSTPRGRTRSTSLASFRQRFNPCRGWIRDVLSPSVSLCSTHGYSNLSPAETGTIC